MYIVKKYIISLLRDKGSLFIIAFFPIILVFLLGNLLNNVYTSEEKIETINLHYIINTKDKTALQGINILLSTLEENKSISISKTKDYEKSIDLLSKGKIDTLVIFKEPIEIDINEGSDYTKNQAVQSIFRGFIRQLASEKVLISNNISYKKLSPSNEISVIKKVNSRNMIDYYAVAMIIMIIFFGSSIGAANNMYESRRNGTLARMMVSSKSRTSIYIQSVIGYIPQSLIQILCIMIPSAVFFDAQYADTIKDNIILFLTFLIPCICICSIFMIVGLLLKRTPTIIIIPLMWFMLFISGTFSKDIHIKGFSELSPAWQIQKAAFDLIISNNKENCIMIISISLLLLILSIVIGSILINRKEAIIK